MKKPTLPLFAAFSLAILISAFLYGCADTKPIPTGMTPEGRAYRGASAPKLVIYEYSDFECPYCGAVQPTVEQMMRAYQDRAQLQFRHYPLPIHPDAVPAALASACAEKQGKFWEMHDKLYANQKALSESDLAKYASEIGLDPGIFKACVASSEARAVVDNDRATGVTQGVRATPTFLIGESMVEGSQPYDKFQQVMDAELARAG